MLERGIDFDCILSILNNFTMKRPAILFLVSFLGFIPAFSQTVRVETSEVIPMSYKKALVKHLHSDETGHYLYFKEYSKKEFHVTLDKFSPDFQLLFSKIFPSPGADFNAIGAVYFNNRLGVIRNEKDAKAGKIRYTFTPVSMEGVAGAPIALATMPLNRKKLMPFAKWAVSEDGSRMFFAAWYDKDKDDLPFEAELVVIGPDMKPQWEQRIRLPQTEAQIDIDTMIVDNQGVAYAMAKVFKGKQEGNIIWENEELVQGYDMTVMRFTADAAQPGLFPVRGEGVFVKSATFGLSPDGQLVAVGICSKELKEPVHGAILKTWDIETGRALRVEYAQFPEKHLKWMDKRNPRKGQQAENGFREQFFFGEVHFDENGTVVTAARQFFAEVVSTRNGPGNVHFKCNYIVHLQFGSASGEALATIIPKTQININFQWHLGFKTLRSNGRTFII